MNLQIDDDVVEAADNYLNRMSSIAAFGPRVGAQYLESLIRVARSKLRTGEDLDHIAWVVEALSADDGDEEPLSYAEIATQSCIGVTQTGERCSRWAGEFSSGGFGAGELYLCNKHMDQAPEAWRAWTAAVERLQSWADTMTKVAESIGDTNTTERVYFIGDGRHMKIGVSSNVQQRFETLASEIRRGTQGTLHPEGVNPTSLRIELELPGGRDLERKLHRTCGRWRSDGEWFRDCLDFRLHLSSIGIPINTNVKAFA